MTVTKKEVVVEKATSLFVPAYGRGKEGTEWGIRMVPTAFDEDSITVSLLDQHGNTVATNGIGDDGVVFSREALKELREDLAELLGLNEEA
jgi:hypothetical protein